MATYTTNLNLEKPDSSDAFGDFRESYNDNMDKIDAGIGSSGGHTIVDENGSDMPAESKLQFTGGVTVTDDNVNGVTVVDITGGGGNVRGDRHSSRVEAKNPALLSNRDGYLSELTGWTQGYQCMISHVISA